MSEMKATRDAYGEVLVQLGKANPDIVVLDSDLSSSTKTGVFARAFPDRFFNAGIAEANMMGMAAGLARSGKIPFASTFAIFATGRAYDQIRQSIAYPRFNVKIVASHGGLTVGPDGASHQALEDIALMRVIPGMTVIVPCDAKETELAVKAAAEYHGPVYIRLGREKVLPVLTSEDKFEIGKGLVLWPKVKSGESFDSICKQLRQKRPGKPAFDVCFIACGVTVQLALEAARALETEGISCLVVDMASVKPIDEDLLIKAAQNSTALLTCEEHSVVGGLGSAVCEVVSGPHPIRVIRLGVNDQFGQSGSAGELLEAYGLTTRRFCDEARKAVKMQY
jgi:transketolase